MNATDAGVAMKSVNAEDLSGLDVDHASEPEVFQMRGTEDNRIQPGDCVLRCRACNVIFHGAASSKACPCCHVWNKVEHWRA